MKGEAMAQYADSASVHTLCPSQLECVAYMGLQHTLLLLDQCVPLSFTSVPLRCVLCTAVLLQTTHVYGMSAEQLDKSLNKSFSSLTGHLTCCKTPPIPMNK